MPRKELTPEEKSWKKVSGEMFSQIQALKKAVKDYSYKDKPSSLVTDEKLCGSFLKSLSRAKKSLFSISDICFSLHVGEEFIPLTEVMRDEVDILSDEIKIRHCEWGSQMPEFLKKIIRHDLALFKGLEKLNKNLRIIDRGIVKEAKKNKNKPEFWKRVKKVLLQVRKQVRDLAILFKEREALCNIHPITLERTFKKIQEEIRWKV